MVPNAVDLAQFTPGPKNPALLARYNLAGKRVLMGMARLDARERYKGFDEVMDAMPTLLRSHPDLAYMICGDGTDRARLEAKARDLGIAERVVFTGYVDEAEKVDHYRLADCFLLAGWGEGFGIVLIEALSGGTWTIPVAHLRGQGDHVERRVKDLPTDVPKNICELIVSCLSVSRQRRPTMREIRDAFAAIAVVPQLSAGVFKSS